MPIQVHPTRRKTRWSTPPSRPSAGPHAQPYRRRRPETTTLHRIVREHLETYLALANESDPMGDGVPDHVEKEFRSRTASAVLHILFRALRVTLREACPTAPRTASFGAVSFLHRFGSSLNPHFHFHVCVVDGLFERVEDGTVQDPANSESHLRFHEATPLTHELLEGLQHLVRRRVLRHFRRHGLLEPHEAEDMLTWDHGGGFSLDGSVRIEATDRAGLERLIRYCARPPFALDRLHLVGNRSDQVLYLLPGPDLAGHNALRLSALEFLDRLAKILPPPRIHRHRYHGVFAPNAPLRPLVTAQTQEHNALAAQALGPPLPLPTSPTSEAIPPQPHDATPSLPPRPHSSGNLRGS